MDTDRHTKLAEGFDGGFRQLGDFFRETSTIGIAQHDHASSGLCGSANRLGSVLRIRFPAVEEVFRVVDRLASFGDHQTYRVFDHGKVFFQRYPQNVGDMKVVRLADDSNHWRAGVKQGLHAGVVFGSHPFAARHSKGTHLHMLQV